MPHQLNSTWTVWRKEINNRDWSINGYKKVYSFDTIEDFWKFFKDMKYYDYNFYLMRGDITPMYEDKANLNGCMVTYLSKKYNFMREFEDLLVHAVGEQLCDEEYAVNGVSISMKQRSVVMQIWLKNKEGAEKIHWRFGSPDFQGRKLKDY